MVVYTLCIYHGDYKYEGEQMHNTLLMLLEQKCHIRAYRLMCCEWGVWMISSRPCKSQQFIIMVTLTSLHSMLCIKLQLLLMRLKFESEFNLDACVGRLDTMRRKQTKYLQIVSVR